MYLTMKKNNTTNLFKKKTNKIYTKVTLKKLKNWKIMK
jgi:hypothetical protein